MRNETLGSILLLLLISGAGYGQTSFQELTPGQSTRSDVTRALGQPVRTISATILEYNPPAGIAKVEVAYSGGSDLVERIEVYFPKPISRTALIQKFNLSPQADDRRTSAERKLVEYFGGGSLLTFTYASADSSSGVSHVGYYSEELFAAALEITPNRVQPSTGEAASNNSGGSANACGYSLGSGIYSKWVELGGDRGVLRCPVMSEAEAAPSPQGTTGRHAMFSGADEGGAIYWHRDGKYAGQSFETHGAIYKFFNNLGGSSSWLGFPISDEYGDYGVPGERRSNFENGYVTWNARTNRCQVFRYRSVETVKRRR
jgi:hypothetical protein